MSVETQHLQYRNLLKDLMANGVSAPILTTDFKTIKAVASFLTAPNMNFVVYGSYNPSYGAVPNIANALTADNEYHLLPYTDELEVTYFPGTPYNPAGVAAEKAFNIETTGENWVIFAITGYVAGELDFLHSDLYSNFN